MFTMSIEHFIEAHQNTLEGVSLQFKRFIYQEVDWKERVIGLIGPRGVGKTTLLLQHYLEKYQSASRLLYISCDQIQLTSNGLFPLAKEYFQNGGEGLILDEIHKYPSWGQEVKNIIDTYKTKKLFLSGSSTIAFSKGMADLSRRVAQYKLPGLSFREFLNLTEGTDFDPLPLKDLLKNQLSLSEAICKNLNPIPLFKEYLKLGHYPFFLEGKKTFQIKLMNVVEKVISEDIPILFGVSATQVPYLRKMLWLVASSPPFTPNIEKISSNLKLSKEYTYKYFEYLETAGLIQFLRGFPLGHKLIRKPEKIFISDSNLLTAIVGSAQIQSSIGSIRETFFVNQVKVDYPIFSSNKGDFQVDDFTFEIGGPSKNRKQIADVKNAFLVLDNIEHGYRNTIPLYLFGFLY